MDTYQILSLTLGSGVGATVLGYVVARIKRVSAETEALKSGVQALLRDRLLRTYERCEVKGYADMPTRQNFENMWLQYHSLGQNGVMDTVRDKFHDLPISKEDE